MNIITIWAFILVFSYLLSTVITLNKDLEIQELKVKIKALETEKRNIIRGFDRGELK